MRLYSFTNMYLSPIQCGIQTAHALHEMYEKYRYPFSSNDKRHEMIRDWAKDHKTIIVLNGGYQSNLHEIYTKFQEVNAFTDVQFPYTKFHEEEDSLNGALTSVCAVLPELIYGADPKEIAWYRDWTFDRSRTQTEKEILLDLITTIKSCRLA